MLVRRVAMMRLPLLSVRRLGRNAEGQIAARRAKTLAETYGLQTPFMLFSEQDREFLGVQVPWDPPLIEATAVVPKLTGREHVVLRSLADTASFEEIARRLHVSPNTVKSQRRTLYRKLGARSREDALAIGVAHGLLREPLEPTARSQTSLPPESAN
jgi:LuxR family maltose regulon positive regulatory protein